MLRRAFQYAIHAIQDQNYPGSDNAWIDQALRKLEWVKVKSNSNETAMTLTLLEDVIRASDTTIEDIQPVFGDDIAHLLEQVLMDIDTYDELQNAYDVLCSLKTASSIVKTVKLISTIVHVENYTYDVDYLRALKYLDSRLMLIESLRDDDLSLHQQARQLIINQRSSFRLDTALN